jgi:hypothetical protein
VKDAGLIWKAAAEAVVAVDPESVIDRILESGDCFLISKVVERVKNIPHLSLETTSDSELLVNLAKLCRARAFDTAPIIRRILQLPLVPEQATFVNQACTELGLADELLSVVGNGLDSDPITVLRYLETPFLSDRKSEFLPQFAKLVSNPDHKVRRLVAKAILTNELGGQEILKVLVDDEDPEVYYEAVNALCLLFVDASLVKLSQLHLVAATPRSLARAVKPLPVLVDRLLSADSGFGCSSESDLFFLSASGIRVS